MLSMAYREQRVLVFPHVHLLSHQLRTAHLSARTRSRARRLSAGLDACLFQINTNERHPRHAAKNRALHIPTPHQPFPLDIPAAASSTPVAALKRRGPPTTHILWPRGADVGANAVDGQRSVRVSAIAVSR